MGLPHTPGEDLALAWWWPKEPWLLHLHELHSYSMVKSSQDQKDVGYQTLPELWGNLDIEDTWAWNHQFSYSSWLKRLRWHRIAHFPWMCIKGKGRMPSQLSRGKENGMLFCVLTLGSFPYLLSPGLSKEITAKSAGFYRVCTILKENLCNFFL